MAEDVFPIESLPTEVLHKIFGWLRRCPWKWPLAQCSTTLYSAFQFHVERRKKYIEKSDFGLQYAAAWGDPILTQVHIEPKRQTFRFRRLLFTSGTFSLFHHFESERVSVSFYAQCVRTLLRKFYVHAHPLDPQYIEDALTYVWETLEQRSTNSFYKKYFLECCTGPIYIYDTGFLREKLIGLLQEEWRRRQRGRYSGLKNMYLDIAREYFYAGYPEKGLAWVERKAEVLGFHLISEKFEASHSFFGAATRASIPEYPNEDTIRRAYQHFRSCYLEWEGAEDVCTVRKKFLRTLERNIADLCHTPLFADRMLRFYTENASLNLERVWICTGCKNRWFYDRWNLQIPKCLEYLFSHWTKTIDFHYRYCLRNLRKIEVELDSTIASEDPQRAYALKVWCKKCKQLNLSADARKSTRCFYCRHPWDNEIEVPSSVSNKQDVYH